MTSPVISLVGCTTTSWPTQTTLLTKPDDEAQVVGDQTMVRRWLSSSQQAVETFLDVGVQAGGRLVQQQQLRFAGQGAGDQHPLLLAAAEGGEVAVRMVGQPHFGQGGAGRLPVAAAPGPQHRRPAQTAHQHHVQGA